MGRNHGQLPAGQPGHRRKAADAALPPEIHVKGLHRVVQVMPQGHLVAAQFLGGGVQGAAAQLGAEGAGILLLAVVKHHGADVGAADVVGDVVLGGKKVGQGRVVGGLRPTEAGGPASPPPPRRARPDTGAAGPDATVRATLSFPPDTPTQHAVTGGDHLIVLYCLAHQGLPDAARHGLPSYQKLLTCYYTMLPPAMLQFYCRVTAVCEKIKIRGGEY